MQDGTYADVHGGGRGELVASDGQVRRELQRHLAQVREHGYAVDRGELEPHLCCVAGPIFDRTGTVVASISVSGPDSRVDEASIPSMADAVRRAAWQISARLGAPREIPEWSSAAGDRERAGRADRGAS